MNRRWISLGLLVLAVVAVLVFLVLRGPSTGGPKPVQAASGITIRLDALMYDDGSTVSATLVFEETAPAANDIKIALTATDSRDVETLTLRRGSNPLVYESGQGTIRIEATPSQSRAAIEDETLSMAPGQVFYALYFPDKSDPVLADVQADVISDFAFLVDDADPGNAVNPDAALTDDEDDAAERPAGTLLRRGSLPVQVATKELIFWSRNAEELTAFLDRTGGRLISSRPNDSGVGQAGVTMHLVQVQPPEGAARSLRLLDAFLGEERDILASNMDVLNLLAYGLQLRIDGFMVSPNARLLPHDAPRISTTETLNVTRTMEMHGPTEPCIPGNAALPCTESAPALWAYLSLWDFDDERVNVAVLDQGFATNDDFRPPAAGPTVECRVGVAGSPLCGPFMAQGTPTVGNSLFGERSWHGTGVVHTLGAIVNNDALVAGTGGQVAVPMLYRYDLGSYAFGIDAGIRDAVDRGASCINISAGFPCNILTDFGNYDLCNWEGRVGVCGVVTAGTAAAVAATCAASSWIPIIGPAICGGAQAVLYVETTVCLHSLVFFENLRGPVLGAIEFAEANGVPVIVSAGNAMDGDQLPDVVRDFINLGNWDADRWGVIPAISPEAITVGSAFSAAVDPADNPGGGQRYRNDNFFGDSVDIWAPVRTRYGAPLDVNNLSSMVSVDNADGQRLTIGATSGAAAYITGVVAAMQAANPDLDPTTPGLSIADRSTIVQRIRDILIDDANSFTNMELAAFTDASGAAIHANQPIRRPRLVDSLAAVKAAALGNLPDFDAQGYDAALNFDEGPTSNTTPQAITFDTEYTGTILSMPEDDGDIPNPDEDRFTYSLPTTGADVFESTVMLTYPTGFGDLEVTATGTIPGSGVVLANEAVFGGDQVRTYRNLAHAGDTMTVIVAGATSDQDNVYKLVVASPVEAIPTVTITSPVNDERICVEGTTTSVTLSADVSFLGFPAFPIPANEINWFDRLIPLGFGANLTADLTQGGHSIFVQAFQPAYSDAVYVNLIVCGSNPPTARIVMPRAPLHGLSGPVEIELTDWDPGQNESYVEVMLLGDGWDNEDGALPASGLAWYTQHSGGVQTPYIQTGNGPARLYAPGRCVSGFTHLIQLIATDSDGLQSAPDEVEVVLRTPPDDFSCP